MMKQLYFHTISSKNVTLTQINIHAYPGPLNNRDLKIPRSRCKGMGTAPCLAILGNDISSVPGNLAV